MKYLGKYKMNEEIEVYKINGKNLALYGWNTEIYTDCFEVDENLIDVINKEKSYQVKPIYKFEIDNIDLETLEENSNEWNEALKVVDFKIL